MKNESNIKLFFLFFLVSSRQREYSKPAKSIDRKIKIRIYHTIELKLKKILHNSKIQYNQDSDYVELTGTFSRKKKKKKEKLKKRDSNLHFYIS